MTTYLRAADALAPALLDGLYVIGSLPLGDYRPGVSDIDIVGLVGRPLDQESLDRLAEVHARVSQAAGSPSIDGVYVTRDMLAGPPEAAGSTPYARDGRLHREGMALTPVIWQSLRDHSIVVRGPLGRELCPDAGGDTIRRWTYSNMMSYWRDLLVRCRAGLVSRAAGTPVAGDTAVWMVLGVSRSYHTLVTGELTSKQGGGEYALRVFSDRWRPVIEESLGIRRAGDATATVSEVSFTEVIRFVEMVLREAKRVGPPPDGGRTRSGGM